MDEEEHSENDITDAVSDTVTVENEINVTVVKGSNSEFLYSGEICLENNTERQVPLPGVSPDVGEMASGGDFL